MSAKTIGTRIRVYAIGIVLLGGGVTIATMGRSGVQASPTPGAPTVSIGQESIHAVE
jgi:hypothetical protein